MKNLFSFVLAMALVISHSTQAIPKYWDEYSSIERREALIQEMTELEHQRFRRDCSGYVQAVLLSLGHDVSQFINSYNVRSNGVDQIYQYVERSGDIYKDKAPSTGDLIFFSNTYDVNRDGRINDKLSHIGIVTNIDNDGTISFRHVIQGSIQTDYINLSKPTVHSHKGRIINSYLRRAGKNSAYPATTAQLFDFFGSLDR